MNEPLAALVAAAQHLLDTTMEDLTYGDFLPLTKALAVIPPDAVLVTEAELAFLRREAHSFDECRRRVKEARISSDRSGYPWW